MTSSIRRIIHFWRGVFRRPQRQQDEDEARAAAGGESNYCQGTRSNPEELLPFHLDSMLNDDTTWKEEYTAQSYGFPLNHDSTIAVENQKFLPDHIYVYVDGSVKKKEQQSGVGLFYGYKHPLTCYIDITEPVNNLQTTQKLKDAHNSDLIETMAAIVALKRLANWKKFNDNEKIVVIRSDNLNMIQQLNKVQSWYDSNGNYKGKGQLSLLKKFYTDLLKIADSFSNGVEFQHVKAHCGDAGNLIADYLSHRALETWGPQAVWKQPKDFTANFHNGNWLSFITEHQSTDDFLQDVENMLAALP